MAMSTSRFLVAALATAILSFASLTASAQCTKDTECKGDSICSAGRCVDAGTSVVAPSARAVQAPAPEAEPPPVEPQRPRVRRSLPVAADPPAGTVRYEKRRRPGLLITGLVLLGVGWIGAIVTATLEAAYVSGSGHENVECGSSYGYLYVPILGGFYAAGTAPDKYSGGSCWSQGDHTAVFAGGLITGLMQLVGLSLALRGGIPSDQPVETVAERATSPRWTLAPMAGPHTLGASLVVTRF